MKRLEAIQAMRDGRKVTHQYFTEDEFLYMKSGRVYSEDGVSWGDGWGDSWRGTCLDPTYTLFNEGWEIIE